MGLVGQLSQSGQAPRAQGSRPCSGPSLLWLYSLKASPPFHVYLGGGEGSGPGLSPVPLLCTPTQKGQIGPD